MGSTHAMPSATAWPTVLCAFFLASASSSWLMVASWISSVEFIPSLRRLDEGAVSPEKLMIYA